MKEYFEYLDKNFPLIDGKVRVDSVSKLSDNQIIDRAKYITSLIPAPGLKIERSIFNHCASLSLSGDRTECFAYSCRENNLNKLARIAALYSDKVYINNFFSYFQSHCLCDDNIGVNFYNDLSLVYFIRPLLESGRISIISKVPPLCPTCMSGAIVGDKKNKKRIKEVNSAVSDIAKEYFERSTVYIESNGNGEFRYCIKAPPPYFEHGVRYYSGIVLPDFLLANQRIKKELEVKGRVKLSKKYQNELALHVDDANDIKHQIFYETYVNDVLGTTYLTDKTIHLKFLEKISNNPDISKRNSIISNYLTTIVPFAEDVPINKLLSLREREEESFCQFRASINDAIFETNNLCEKIDDLKAREIYSDIIYPKIRKLDLKVKEAKKDLVKTTYRSLVGVVGAISFGMYTGLLPSEALAIAKALGVGKVCNDLIVKLMALGDAKNSIKGEDLYFLWQIKKISEQEEKIKKIKSAN